MTNSIFKYSNVYWVLYLAWVLLLSVFLLENWGESIIRWQVANSQFLSYTLSMKSGQSSIFDAFYLLNLIYPIFIVLILSLCIVTAIGIIMNLILDAILNKDHK